MDSPVVLHLPPISDSWQLHRRWGSGERFSPSMHSVKVLLTPTHNKMNRSMFLTFHFYLTRPLQGQEPVSTLWKLVQLPALRTYLQFPICLGIIKKTKTVTECLCRFCRDCIDKSMRLRNNECPACRTHCASRSSLRDDPRFDALIGRLYEDTDKYEEEELAFHDENKARLNQFQASIAQIFRPQSEALGAKEIKTRLPHPLEEYTAVAENILEEEEEIPMEQSVKDPRTMKMRTIMMAQKDHIRLMSGEQKLSRKGRKGLGNSLHHGTCSEHRDACLS